MTDFLGALINRNLGGEPQIVPRLPSLYESGTAPVGTIPAPGERADDLEESHHAAPAAPSRQAVQWDADTWSLLRRPDPRGIEDRPASPKDRSEPVLSGSAFESAPSVRSSGSRNDAVALPTLSGRHEEYVEEQARGPAVRQPRANSERYAEHRLERGAQVPAVATEPQRPQHQVSVEPAVPLSKEETAHPSTPKDVRRVSAAFPDRVIPNYSVLPSPGALLTPVVPSVPTAERPAPKAEPVINVTIGRIEVRATVPPQKQPARPPTRPPIMGLDEYLSRRSGRYD